MDESRYRVRRVRGKIDGVGSMPLDPVAPIQAILVRNPCGHTSSKKYCSQREAVEKDRLLILLRLGICNCFAQRFELTCNIKAGKKRKRHTPADVHPDLVKQAWVEVDCRPTPIGPKKLDFEDSEIAEF